ncbi:hypothetical protein RFI_35656, partial [Reticulomyxa filosa]
VKYDQYIQQTMQISEIWNHSIDLNLVHITLQNVQGEIDEIIEYLSIFEAWKMQKNNMKKYEKNKIKFIERRCCNHNINLFSIFLEEEKFIKKNSIEFAAINTINNGMPFVEKDKETINNNK